MGGAGEFDFIRSQLAPLSAEAQGAADLRDDGAILELGPGEQLAVTADILIEGRHFPVGEDPALATRKALRVNLSDLAAMGARPFGYTTSIVWPQADNEARQTGFVEGLRLDQDRYGVRLIGGDTTSADAPWTLSITAFGRLPTGMSLRRSKAREGDLLVVTGTIGDAGLGLDIALEQWTPASGGDRTALLGRLRLPEPRIGVGLLARRFANAAIDISDGLLSEARHLARESGLIAELDLNCMPLSGPARRWLESQTDQVAGRSRLASAGDDYELLLAVAPSEYKAFAAEVEPTGLSLTSVGHLKRAREAPGLEVLADSTPLEIDRLGFTQF